MTEPRTAEEMAQAILARDPRADVRAEDLHVEWGVFANGHYVWRDARTGARYLGARVAP